MSQTNGRFIWHELVTTDVDAAKAFYTEVMGWKTQPFEGGPKEYTMFVVGEQPMGGVMAFPDEAKEAGVPPHWLGHIEVSDVAASVKKCEELGGKIHLPPQSIPQVGTFAIAADPQNVVFSMFQPEGDSPKLDQGALGQIGWNELNTTDYESAWKFYSELFGWKEIESMDMGEDLGTYFMFANKAADGSMGGMSNVAKTQGFPAHWLFYVNVDDIDAAVERVKKHGGKIMNGPMDVPGGSKIAQCMDPQGVAFAIHWMAK